MSARFVIREGSMGGEHDAGAGDDPGTLLKRRDWLRRGTDPRRFVFDVIDTESVDPPETGVVEWCEICEVTPMLASQEECLHCQGLPALKGEDLHRSTP